MPYLSPSADGQRNSITQTLMNIANPPPTQPLAQQINPAPQMQLPQMPAPGGPPQGMPVPQVPPVQMPFSAGVPPQPAPGAAPPGAPPPGMPQGQLPPQGPQGY